MAFNKGVGKIKQEIDAEEAARQAAFPKKDFVPFLSFKDREMVVLRFLTDADSTNEGADTFIKIAFHAFVNTKPAPAGFKNWPKSMGAVCRNDKQIADMFPDGCYICDNKLTNAYNNVAKATPRVYALAVEREEVIGDGSPELGGPENAGVHLGYGDVAEEYKEVGEDGKVIDKVLYRPKIVVVRQAWNNFFGAIAHCYTMSHPDPAQRTILTQDYAIRKSGEGTSVSFDPFPLPATPDHAPGTESWKRYTDELERRKISLEELVLADASDEHIAKFFDPSKEVDREGNVVPAGTSSRGSSSTGPAPASAPKPVDPTIAARIAKLQGRVGQPS